MLPVRHLRDMGERYLEYRRITETLISRGPLSRVSRAAQDVQELAEEHLATPQELEVRRAFIRALTEEFESTDKC